MKKVSNHLVRRLFTACLLSLWGLGGLYANDTIRMSWTEEDAYYYTQSFSIVATNGEQFVIDWGDGGIDTLTGAQNAQSFNRVYNSAYSKHYTLTIIGLTGNCRFDSLDCKWLDRLTELSLNCPALSILDYAGNNLSTLDVSQFPNLQELGCGYNQITALDLSNNTKLRWFSCGWNLLTALDLSNNTGLEDLYCSGNLLTALDLSSNTKLITLYCNDNQLTNLTLSKDTKFLMMVDCSNNRLQLSNLYHVFKLMYNPGLPMHRLDTQRLFPQEVKVDSLIDFSEQAVFDGKNTVFAVEKNGVPANSNTYSINNGIIQFKDTGYYTISMTNAAITLPHKVIAEFNVIKSNTSVISVTNEELEITNTNYELRVTNYELQTLNIELFDVMGRNVGTWRAASNETTINISYLSCPEYG